MNRVNNLNWWVSLFKNYYKVNNLNKNFNIEGNFFVLNLIIEQ